MQELDNQTAQLKDKNDQAVAIENELQDQAEVLNGEIVSSWSQCCLQILSLAEVTLCKRKQKQASDDREEAKKPMAAWSRARVRLGTRTVSEDQELIPDALLCSSDQKVKDLAREKKAPSTEVQRKKLQGQVSELSASRLQYALQYKVLQRSTQHGWRDAR